MVVFAMLNTATSALSTVSLCRALALFDGIRLVSSDSRFNDDKQLDAEALIRYVDNAHSKIGTHLLKRGFVVEDSAPEAEEIAPEIVVDDTLASELSDDEIDAAFHAAQ